MIFVTVGTQLPFDRLIQGVDRWAQARGRKDVFAQIGAGATYKPQYIAYAKTIPMDVFAEKIASASVIVAHAGIGTILSGLELGKPVLVCPRRASLGEHRNEHQLATVERFSGMKLVAVAHNDEELAAQLDRLEQIAPGGDKIANRASDQLLNALRHFIHDKDLTNV
jgi:UDP-N-acetylglucosamine transferase subunit ALG13